MEMMLPHNEICFAALTNLTESNNQSYVFSGVFVTGQFRFPCVFHDLTTLWTFISSFKLFTCGNLSSCEMMKLEKFCPLGLDIVDIIKTLSSFVASWRCLVIMTVILLKRPIRPTRRSLKRNEAVLALCKMSLLLLFQRQPLLMQGYKWTGKPRATNRREPLQAN